MSNRRRKYNPRQYYLHLDARPNEVMTFDPPATIITEGDKSIYEIGPLDERQMFAAAMGVATNAPLRYRHPTIYRVRCGVKVKLGLNLALVDGEWLLDQKRRWSRIRLDMAEELQMRLVLSGRVCGLPHWDLDYDDLYRKAKHKIRRLERALVYSRRKAVLGDKFKQMFQDRDAQLCHAKAINGQMQYRQAMDLLVLQAMGVDVNKIDYHAKPVVAVGWNYPAKNFDPAHVLKHLELFGVDGAAAVTRLKQLHAEELIKLGGVEQPEPQYVLYAFHPLHKPNERWLHVFTANDAGLASIQNLS